jgi:hypothetical protein
MEMKKLLLALLALSCATDPPQEIEQWQLPKPVEAVGPALTPPPTLDGLPTETLDEYYERLRKDLPEGATVSPERQRPMPAYIERALFIDGSEATQQFNADGTEFVPEPEPTGFAITPDGDPEIDAPICGGDWMPCPCYTSGWHKDSDWWGSAVLQPGVCWITDSPNVTYNFVQKLRDGTGGFSEFAEPTFVRHDYFSSNWTTELSRLYTEFNTAPDFTMSFRAPLAGWGPHPPGFYALPGMPFTVAYPPDRLKYPALTDLVFRVGKIPADKSWYGSHSSKQLVGLTKTFFVAFTPFTIKRRYSIGRLVGLANNCST